MILSLHVLWLQIQISEEAKRLTTYAVMETTK